MNLLWYPPSATRPEPPPEPRHELSLAPRPCPACERPGEIVELGCVTCVGTCGPHDPNCVEGIFECGAGHRFYATTQYTCSCGWSNVHECEISGHDRRTLFEDMAAPPITDGISLADLAARLAPPGPTGGGGE